MLKILKTHPSIASGWNNTQLEDNIQAAYKLVEDPILVSGDGSNHDSSMRKEWFEMMDFEFYKTFGKYALDALDIDRAFKN